MKHHPACQAEHAAIEEMVAQLPEHEHITIAPAIYAQLSIANRLAGIEEVLWAQLATGDGRITAPAAARAAAEERYGGLQ